MQEWDLKFELWLSDHKAPKEQNVGSIGRCGEQLGGQVSG